MKTRSMFSKTLAAVLVLVMLIGLMPMAASAETAGNDGVNLSATDSTDGLHLNKTAVLQADGTWTITLEAYATGYVQSEVHRQVLPTDIVLVLDQSGSMNDSSYYVTLSSDTYLHAGHVTNKEIEEGTTQYYYKVDGVYYPVTIARHALVQRRYWVDASGTQVDASLVSTTWTAGDSTQTLSGVGYLNTDYVVYQRVDGTQNNRYIYQPVSGAGTSYDNAQPTEQARANQARNNLAALWPDKTITYTSGYTYALVYEPLTYVNADTYYYTYYYKDASGNDIVIGNTVANDDSSLNGEDLAEQYYDSSLGILYTFHKQNEKVSRLTLLQSAANFFVDDMRIAALEHQVDHRIAMVGFASTDTAGSDFGDQYYYSNTELIIGSKQYNLVYGGTESTINSGSYYSGTTGKLNVGTGSIYAEAYQSVLNTAGYNNLKVAIDKLAAYGGTFPSHGLEMAKNIFDSNPITDSQRERVVVFLTDGEPGWKGFEDSESKLTQDWAKLLKGTGDVSDFQTTNFIQTYLGGAAEATSAPGYDATIYTVALLNNMPTDGGNVDTFLNNVTTAGIEGTKRAETSTWENYFLALNGVGLDGFFATIENSIDSTTALVDLTENAYMVDRVSDFFQIPDGFNIGSDVTIKVVPANGKTESGVYTFDDSNATTFTMSANDTIYESTTAWDGKKIQASTSGNVNDDLVHGVTVHNFNYVSDLNMVKTNSDNTVSGNKLVVEIRGILAKDIAALEGAAVPTNNDHSGIWDTVKNADGTHQDVYGLLKAFDIPTAAIGNQSFVLDYAKKAQLPIEGMTMLGVDGAIDEVFSGFANTSGTVYNTVLSTVAEDADHRDVFYGDVGIESGVMTYTPKTIRWDDFDTFYAFGKKTDDSYSWNRVTVIPANNVYYEDTFVTTSTDASTKTGTVGIIYSTLGFKWDEIKETNAGTNTESANTSVHGGWTDYDPTNAEDSNDGLADDTGYSDGTVHKGSANAEGGATATFTFTGTGVDIYSYTDSTTGTILVMVKPDDATAQKGAATQYYIVDNLSASGKYYQVPTVCFASTDKNGDPIHGTYTVTITVTAAAGERLNYYLDGIRVYNPLSDTVKSEPDVDMAYGEELNATFETVREHLLQAGDFVPDGATENVDQAAGFVFIDELKDGQVPEGDDTLVGDPDTITDHVVGVYKDYGPKNEVYLGAGQAIAFAVGNNIRVQVGLKALEGKAVTANVSHYSDGEAVQGEILIEHTSDLFYEVAPIDGYVVIKNTGENLLAITKVKFIDPSSTKVEITAAPVTEAEILSAVNTFTLLRRVTYSSAVVEDSTEEESPEIPEIDISNPEPETPEEPSFEDQIKDQIEALVERLFKSIRDWFKY